MKRLLYFAALVIFVTACKKNIHDDLQKNNDEITDINNSLSPVPAPAYQWSQLPKPVLPANSSQTADGLNNVIQVNGSVYCIKGFYHSKELYKLNTTTKTWAPSNDFVPEAAPQYLFAYGSKIYFGLSIVPPTIYSGMSAYDVTTGTETSMATFPGTAVTGATTFVIGNKGYLMGGKNVNDVLIEQFWEYNFSTNQWTNKGSTPLGRRGGASAFVIGNKAYIGMGYGYIYLNGQQITQYKNDWILFDPSTGLGAIRADFPGPKRSIAKGFIIDNNIYVGFGANASGFLRDFWKYNTSSNTWTQQDTWPGTIESNKNDWGPFVLGSTGYLVKGELAEFWKFSNSLFATQ